MQVLVLSSSSAVALVELAEDLGALELVPGLLGCGRVVPRVFGPFVVGSRVVVPPDAPLRLLLGAGEVADAVDRPLRVHLLDYALLFQLARPGEGLGVGGVLGEHLGVDLGAGLVAVVLLGGLPVGGPVVAVLLLVVLGRRPGGVLSW